MPESIKLNNATVSHPHFFKALPFGGEGGKGNPYYDGSIILDKKKDKAQIESLNSKVAAFVKENNLGGAETFIHDGSEKKDPGYGPGVIFLRVKSDAEHPPTVIDRNKTPLKAADNKIYGGAVCNIWISLWGQNHPKYGKWVGANLRGVQFVKDGPRLGGETIDLDSEAENLEDDDDPSK